MNSKLFNLRFLLFIIDIFQKRRSLYPLSLISIRSNLKNTQIVFNTCDFPNTFFFS